MQSYKKIIYKMNMYEISPLRFAPVEMTALSAKSVSVSELNS